MAQRLTLPVLFLGMLLSACSTSTKESPLPGSVMGGGGVYVAGAESGPEWKLRTAFTLLLPRKK